MGQTELLDKYGPFALVTGASSGIGESFAELRGLMGCPYSTAYSASCWRCRVERR